jgi:hypothetical protein
MSRIWVSAAELAVEWRCSLRTAQRAIERVPRPWKERRGRFYFALRIMIKRPRGRGRPPRSH